MSDIKFDRGMLCVGPFRLLAPDDGPFPPPPGSVGWTVETVDYAHFMAGGVEETLEKARLAAINALERICRDTLSDMVKIEPGDSWLDLLEEFQNE